MDAVVRTADQGVVVTKPFLAFAPSSVEALKSATLLKGLRLNALIYGEAGTGKKSLAQYIFPQAPLVSADNFFELLDVIKESKEVIITHFEKISNTQKLQEALDASSCRIIATSSIILPMHLSEPFFSITIELKPLLERPEDIQPLCNKFLEDMSDILTLDRTDFCERVELDLSENTHSLKRSLITQALVQNISEKELMQIFENYLEKNYPEENAYRDCLHLFDKPMIRVGLQKYKSQLKLSDVLGINRNTLRKKIIQYEEYNNE